MYICAPPVCLKAREGVPDSCDLEVLCSCQEQSPGARKHPATSLLLIYITFVYKWPQLSSVL